MSERFTVDGSAALEAHLAGTCEQVWAGVRALFPNGKLEALLLGGGYGRGEGGVLKTEAGDQPYNDLEFYVCLRGNRLLNDRKYRSALHELGERLSGPAGAEVEFKITSTAHLKASSPSMFVYDLAMGHRTVDGSSRTEDFLGAAKESSQIGLEEATRLVMNRASGLLFSEERLRHGHFTAEDADFVGRNHAKAQLAFGDALLTAHKLYHWSCRERHARLTRLESSFPKKAELARHHETGVKFKLHPQKKAGGPDHFREAQRELKELGLALWLWLEGERLGRKFTSAVDYALAETNKCPETSAVRNTAINLRTFGLGAFRRGNYRRYPRERLFNALTLLLWEPRALSEAKLLEGIQKEINSSATDFASLVADYKRLWQRFN